MLDLAAAYEAHADQLRRYVERYVGCPDVADDILGALWLSAVRHAARYEDRGYPVSSWLYRMARSRIVDYYRQHGRWVARHIPLYEGVVAPDAMEAIEDNGLALLAVLNEPSQRAVLALRFVADLSVGEVADRLGKTPGAVKALQHRGIVRLRRAYAD